MWMLYSQPNFMGQFFLLKGPGLYGYMYHFTNVGIQSIRKMGNLLINQV